MSATAAAWAWFATVFCVVFTLRCAFAFAHKHADVFLALCVYAGQFAVLIVFYRSGRQNTLLPAIAGYFSAVAGFLLVRCRHVRAKGHPSSSPELETVHRGIPAPSEVQIAQDLSPAKRDNDQRRTSKVQASEEGVALLLLLVAFPRILANPFGDLFPSAHEPDPNLCVALLLDTFGYFALLRAIVVSHENKWTRLWLSLPLVCYWLLNVTFSGFGIYQTVVHGIPPPPMTDPFAYAFAAIKVITVVTFVPGILAPYESFVRAAWPRKLLIFFHVEESP